MKRKKIKNQKTENEKAAFVLAYGAFAISGGTMGFCIGLFTAWSWWG